MAIDDERTQILNEAREEAEALRQQKEREIQAEMLEKRLIWQQELDREKSSVANELRQSVVNNFLEFSRKAFKQMADESLENRFISVFKSRLADLSGKDKKLLLADSQDAPVQITSSQELTQQTQDDLKKVLIETLDLQNPVFVFKVSPRLLCGIEFSINGNVVSWNLDDYLNTFTEKMNDALETVSLRLSREEN